MPLFQFCNQCHQAFTGTCPTHGAAYLVPIEAPSMEALYAGMTRKVRRTAADYDNLPDYFVRAGKTYVVIDTGARKVKVTQADIAEYYATQAPNISSGCRSLAGMVGDWRPIDNLAHECLEYFKRVDIDGLRRRCKRRGLTPRF